MLAVPLEGASWLQNRVVWLAFDGEWMQNDGFCFWAKHVPDFLCIIRKCMSLLKRQPGSWLEVGSIFEGQQFVNQCHGFQNSDDMVCHGLQIQKFMLVNPPFDHFGATTANLGIILLCY